MNKLMIIPSIKKKDLLKLLVVFDTDEMLKGINEIKQGLKLVKKPLMIIINKVIGVSLLISRDSKFDIY